MTMVLQVKRTVLLCALALACSRYGLAEDTVVVSAAPAETATSPTQGYSAKTSSGATKTDRPLITTGQAVSVVTRQQMEDQHVRNYNEALAYTPGVFSNIGGGSSRFDTVSMRGFHGGDVDNLFLDGMRLMSDGGSHNILQIDPWFIERADVIKGPSSSLYGQSIPGGLVNLTSKRPQFAPEGHLRLSAGTQNTKGAAFDYTDAINNEWAYRITGITRNTDTQYDNTREERYAISPSLLWQPGEDTRLLLRAYLQKDPSGGYHGSVPVEGSVYARNGNKLSNNVNEGDRLDGYQRRQQLYSAEFDHRFNEVWSLHSSGSYTHSNASLDQVYNANIFPTSSPWIGDSDLLNRAYVGSQTSLNAWSTDNRLQADFATGDVDHTVTIGAEYHRFRNDILTLAGTASPLNPFTGETAQTGHTVNYEDDNNRRYYQTGFYLQDDLEWNRWHVTLSGRYDRVASKQVSDTLNTAYRRADDKISGRASILYAFENGLSSWVSYSQALTPSILPSATGELLPPATAEQYEGGLKYQPAGTTDMYSIAIYDLTQKDVSQRDENVSPAVYFATGNVHSQGVELEAHTQITPRLSTIAGYSWNRVKFEDSLGDKDGNTPLLSPDQMASFWAHYQFDYGISAGAGLRYIGKQWADDQNSTRLSSVTLMDAMIKADLGVWNSALKGAFVQVNASNLTDREYVAGCYTTNCYWGAERSVVATVGYDF